MNELMHVDHLQVIKADKDEDWVITELKQEQRDDVLCEASEHTEEMDSISCNGLKGDIIAGAQTDSDELEGIISCAISELFVCQECSKSFRDDRELTDHVKSNHLVRRSHNISAVVSTERKIARKEAAMSRPSKISNKLTTEVFRKCRGCDKHLVNCQRVSELISSTEVGDLCDDCFVASQLENAVTNVDNCLMLTCETHAVDTDYEENDATNNPDIEEIDGDLAVDDFDIASDANNVVADAVDASEDSSSQGIDAKSLGFLENYLLDVADKTDHSALSEVVSLEDAIVRVTGEDNTEMFKCVMCDKLFARHSSVMKHITAIHSNKRLPCDICGRRFRHAESLQLHKLGHTAEGRYSCGNCGIRFKHRASLARHLESHDGVKLVCPECSKSFSHHADLQQHMRLRHLVKNRFNCQYCDRSFYAAGSLKAHLREHAAEKAYRCRICDKVYQRTDTLRNHMMLHSNEWPFVCAQCGARFRHRLSYYRHIDSHKGRELFTCQLCNKTFKHNNALNEHNRRFHPSTVTVLSVDLLKNPQNVEYSVSVTSTV